MNKSELARELKILGDKRQALHWKSEGAKSKNVREERELRRGIARVLTVLNRP